MLNAANLALAEGINQQMKRLFAIRMATFQRRDLRMTRQTIRHNIKLAEDLLSVLGDLHQHAEHQQQQIKERINGFRQNQFGNSKQKCETVSKRLNFTCFLASRGCE